MIQCLYMSLELSHTLTSFNSNVYISNAQKRYHEKSSNSLCRPAESRIRCASSSGISDWTSRCISILISPMLPRVRILWHSFTPSTVITRLQISSSSILDISRRTLEPSLIILYPALKMIKAITMAIKVKR